MKKLLSLLLAALLPAAAVAQISVQKASGTNAVSNGPIVIGSGISLTPSGSGVIEATNLAPGTSVPWADLTAIPSPTFALTGDASTTQTFLASGESTSALTLATVNTNTGSWGTATQAPQFTVNGKGLVTAAANVTVTPAYTNVTSVPTVSLLGNSTGGTANAQAVTPADSVVFSGTNLQLSGDSASPGNSYTYKTNSSGVKGWYADSSDVVTSITGTAGNILANGSGTVPQTGAVTLTLPTAITGVDSVTAELAHTLALNGGSTGAQIVLEIGAGGTSGAVDLFATGGDNAVIVKQGYAATSGQSAIAFWDVNGVERAATGYGNIRGSNFFNQLYYTEVGEVSSAALSMPTDWAVVLTHTTGGTLPAGSFTPIRVYENGDIKMFRADPSIGTVTQSFSLINATTAASFAGNLSAANLSLGGTLTTANSFTTSGNFTVTQTYTGATNVTFPTSGTLATTAGTVASITGTAGEISASASTGAVTLSIPAAMYGPTSIGINTGTTPSATVLQVIDTGTTTPRGITDDQYNTGAQSAQFNARKARGTFASPTTVVTGDILSRFLAWGYDGTQFIESGNLRFTSAGTIATNQVPSQAEIWTSTNASPSVLTRAVYWDDVQSEHVLGTSAATTTATGAIIDSGGLGVSGAGYFGSNVVAPYFGIANNIAQMDLELNTTTYWIQLVKQGVDTTQLKVGANNSGKDLAISNDSLSSSGLEVQYTQDTTGATSGALQVSGGVYDAKSLIVAGSTASTSTTTGAIIDSGGLGVAGAIYGGGAFYAGPNPNTGASYSVGNTQSSATNFSVQNASSNAAALAEVQAYNGSYATSLVTFGTSFASSGFSGANVSALIAGSNHLALVTAEDVQFWYGLTASSSTEFFALNRNNATGNIWHQPLSGATGAWGNQGVFEYHAGATATDNSTAMSGTAALETFFSFAAPTLAATNTGVVTTNAATVYIAGAPTAGTNQTITNGYGLWNVGASRLDGSTLVGGLASTGNGMQVYGVLAFANNAPTGGYFTSFSNSGLNTATSTMLQIKDGGGNNHLILTYGGTWGFATPGAAINAWGASGAAMQVTSNTWTDNSTGVSGTAALETFISFAQPTLAATNTGVITTVAATVYIAGAPAAGTNQTLTNAYALDVAAGNSFFGGTLTISSSTASTSTTTGAIVDSGGLGVAGSIYAGADSYFNGVRVGLGVGAVSSNTAVGTGVMAATATGTNNTAVGNQAMVSLTGGTGNTGVGDRALNAVTTAGSDTAVGQNSMRYATGGNNGSFGANALGGSTFSGTQNNAFGVNALGGVTNGGDNVAVGHRAGLGITTGSANLLLGTHAGEYATSSDEFYLNTIDRSNNAGDKASSLLYGTFNSTASSQTLTVNATLTATYGVSTSTIGYTFAVKSGSNAKAGTFTLAAGVATVANTSVTANSVVIAYLKTVGGTITGPLYYPTVTPSTGFTVAEVGGVTDTSTYNYVILEVN